MSQPPRAAILIHGAGGGGWEWVHWQPVLAARGWAVQAPDLQPAPAGLAATTLDDYVAQVAALAAAAPTPPLLVGASMGGIVALRVAERVAVGGLLLVNSVPPAATPGWPPRPTDFPPLIPWATESTLDGTRASMPEADEATVRWAHPRWRDESGAVLRALHAGVVVARPTAPTLALIGMDDIDVSPAVQQHAAATLGADSIALRGVSHVGALLGRRATLAASLAATWAEGVSTLNDAG